MSLSILVTHVDLDGIGSIILAKEFKLKIDHFMTVNYEDIDDEEFYQKYLLPYDKIYITDLAILESLFNSLKKSGKDFLIFDHHERTKLIYDMDNDKVFFDLEKSGTKLFLEYLNKNKRITRNIKEFVELIDTYDMWKTKDKLWNKAKSLNGLMYLSMNYYVKDYQKYLPFIQTQLQKFNHIKDGFYFTEKEKILIERAKLKEKIEIEKALKTLKLRKDDKDKNFGLFKASSKISNTCSFILENNTNIDYIICINTYNIRNGKISVRTARDDFDVRDLKDIDGHKKAGGGFLSIEDIEKLWLGEISFLEYKNE